MYKINSRPMIDETLVLKIGRKRLFHKRKTLKLDIVCHLDDIILQFFEKYRELNAAKDNMDKLNTKDAAEEYQKIVRELLTIVFGAENTAKLETFYDGKFFEMMIDLTPYLSDHVAPQIEAASRKRVAAARREE